MKTNRHELESGTAQWYAVYTKPQREDWAQLNLNNMGIPTLLPKYRSQDRRKRTRVRPLFPRYLFVQLDLEVPGWASVRYARGVSQLIGFREDNLPSPIPEDVIDAIRRRQDEEGLIKLVETEPMFQHGEAVRIVNGAFEGLDGIFSKHLKDGERVIVLLQLMERWVQVTLHVDQLKKRT